MNDRRNNNRQTQLPTAKVTAETTVSRTATARVSNAAAARASCRYRAAVGTAKATMPARAAASRSYSARKEQLL